MKNSEFQVILFYRFVDIDNPERLRKEQRKLCERLHLKGRMLIAEEGVNATFEGKSEDIDEYCRELKKDPRFSDIEIKMSPGNGEGFPKLKITVRPEIVTLKAGRFNPAKQTAPVVTADELERMYDEDDDFVVLDLRNDYEISSGAFERTIDPGLKQFRDLPQKLASLEHLKKEKKIVTVCTGGIRCEKATCLMKEQGWENIYQLKDGIHTYMKKYPGKHFKGTLFVFDNRMVTDVEKSKTKEVIGRCEYCNVPSETYYSDDSVRPSRKVLACDTCYATHKHELREAVTTA